MSEKLRLSTVEGPQGRFDVSTIRTDSGGAAPSQPFLSPFSSADYAADEPWPYETMVFKDDSSRGQHWRPYSSRKAALAGHEEVVQQVRDGTVPLGVGVKGPNGTPDGIAWNERPRRRVRSRT